MERICSFTINGNLYTIYNVDKICCKVTYVGKTQYDVGKVYIEKGTKEDMLLTLKHELMHIWLYEHGHINQDAKRKFSYEDLCEYVAYSNDFINKIVNKYLNAERYR